MYEHQGPDQRSATAVADRGSPMPFENPAAKLPLLSVSVIIPTRNRPHDLQSTVRSLFGQSTVPQQLIIIDQSVGPESRLSIECLFAAAPDQVRSRLQLIYVLDSTISGLSTARNCAMELATSDVYLFLDDDVVLEPDFVEEVLTAYERHPEASGVSGIITNYRRPPWPARVWTTAFLRGPFQDQRQAVYWNANRLRNSEPLVVNALGGGLMSFRADAVRGCRFDENLHGVCDGEDVDFCVRLRRGTTLMIAPRARLVHNASPSGRLRDHFLRRNARSEYFLYWKNWNHGIKNRLCFLWLNVGFGVMGFLGMLRRRSLEPWRALRAGVQDAREVVGYRISARVKEACAGKSEF